MSLPPHTHTHTHTHTLDLKRAVFLLCEKYNLKSRVTVEFNHGENKVKRTSRQAGIKKLSMLDNFAFLSCFISEGKKLINDMQFC